MFFTPISIQNEEEDVNIMLLTKAKNRLQKAKEAYLDGIDTLEEYKANKAKSEAEIFSLEEKIKKSKKRDLSPLQNKNYVTKLNCLHDILTDEKISMDIKKTTIRGIVQKIVFDKANNTFTLFLYDE